MIIFATSITDPELYRTTAEPGIRLAAEPDSEIVANAAAGSIFRSYNLILDSVADREDLEALVLIHQDAEIASPDFCTTIREALSDPEVGVVGCAGAVGVRSIAWWEGSVTWASFNHRYQEFGGGDLKALSWDTDDLPAYAKTGEVDSIDGFVMVLSPWVVRNVRFDESLGLLHGYDFDFCMAVRAAKRKVVTANFRVIHHHSLQLVSNPETWLSAHMRVAEKWESENGADWRQRARRAEAEASLARTEAFAGMQNADIEKRRLQEEIAEMTGSISWKITAPLRRLNAARKARRAR